MRVAIYTLGCKVNQYETQAMEQELTRRGHTLVPFEDTADAYIINTCSVTAVSDKKSRQMIRRAKAAQSRRGRGRLRLLCPDPPRRGRELWASTSSAAPASGCSSSTCWSRPLPTRRARRPLWIKRLRRRDFEVLPAGGLARRTRAMLKVEDGCVNFCTYCIIPYARGPVRSLPLEQAVAAGAAAWREEGYREIVFTGIEISSWGHDLQRTAPRSSTCSRPSPPPRGDMRLRLGSPGAADHHGGLLPPRRAPCRTSAPSSTSRSSPAATKRSAA